jgi:hypothetical protein
VYQVQQMSLRIETEPWIGIKQILITQTEQRRYAVDTHRTAAYIGPRAGLYLVAKKRILTRPEM